MALILASLLDALVDVLTAFGLLLGLVFMGLWVWIGIEELNVHLARRRLWNQIKQARRELAEDEAVAAIRDMGRPGEYVAGRKSA